MIDVFNKQAKDKLDIIIIIIMILRLNDVADGDAAYCAGCDPVVHR